MINTDRQSFFCSSGYQTDPVIETDSGEQLDMAKLPPFLRTLLVMDGTVTKALESWFWEPVNVIPQVNDQSNQAQILHREVLLQGEHSSRIFACARSSVSLENLPIEISSALSSGRIGIGELLREKGLETYRELFNINCLKSISEEDNLLKMMMLDAPTTPIISRSYKIWLNQNPAITVTEFFPIDRYTDK